jgi:hypothetical protein
MQIMRNCYKVWTISSLQSGQVSTKNNANNLPGLYTKEYDSSFKHQQLLTALFAVVQNGLKLLDEALLTHQKT